MTGADVMETLTFAERLKPGDRVRFRGIEGRHEVESVAALKGGRDAVLRLLIAGGKRIDCGRREFVWVQS